jgi:hypothetical protein
MNRTSLRRTLVRLFYYGAFQAAIFIKKSRITAALNIKIVKTIICLFVALTG